MHFVRWSTSRASWLHMLQVVVIDMGVHKLTGVSELVHLVQVRAAVCVYWGRGSRLTGWDRHGGRSLKTYAAEAGPGICPHPACARMAVPLYDCAECTALMDACQRCVPSQVMPPGLEDRALCFGPLSTLQQKTPGYFDAPGTRGVSSMRAPRTGESGGGSVAGQQLLRPLLPEVTLVFAAVDGYTAMLAADR